ncbi:MAG: hypothetical protein ABIJ15_05340 [bacterium]
MKIKTNDFDFLKTFKSGLFYFFYDDEPKRTVILKNRKINLCFRQKKSFLHITTDKEINVSEKNFLIKRVRYCFGIGENMNEFYGICRKDAVLKTLLPKIKRTRIISAFSDFEALVGAVVSQNNSYANYRKQMNLLYGNLNFKRSKYLGDLRKFKVGYKSGYLNELAGNYGKAAIDKIKGLGNYSLSLFEIFQKRNYGAFYMDCLTEKIMRENYGVKSDFDGASRKLWGKYRGLAEAFLQRFFEKKI